jgi:hypothetical protein
MVMIARNVPARPKARAMLSLESTRWRQGGLNMDCLGLKET